MAAIDNYYAALNRLKQNKPERLEKGTPINKDTVALEAGNKRGAIRNRPEFTQLIKDIEKIMAGERTRTGKAPNRYRRRAENLDAKLKTIVTDKDMAQSRYMSLLYLNYQLSRKLRDSGIEPPQFGTAMDVCIESEVDI
ncbi:hypothetical protein A3759_06145 [Thalassolituus sp. HI0120]|nr:hypothetical protein A3759_06145 [Thalassolituus sp. HI0120]